MLFFEGFGIPATLIVGSQFGDEGKGKIVDILAEKAEMVARFQGGNNAGHTVVVNGNKHKFHLLPSGGIRGKKILIGAGVALNPLVLLKEIGEMEKEGIKVQLTIDTRTQIIMPYHCFFEECGEGALKGNCIGTTRRGIGPGYAERALRTGIRFSDFFSGNFEKKAEENFRFFEKLFRGVYGKKPPYTEKSVLKEYAAAAEKLRKCAGDVSLLVNNALKEKKEVLLEGAQGMWLDLDFGTYPYVTSSHPVSGGACTGIGLSPKKIGKIIGVVKAYSTRVGSGPLPTELKGRQADSIREKGGEYGTTTGRPRRIGWLDLVMLKYSNMVNGFDEIAVTKIDVLSGQEKIKACTGYRLEGKRIGFFPFTTEELAKVNPVYGEFPGFTLEEKEKRELMRSGYPALPENAKKYLGYVEEFLGVPVKFVSFGPDRKETVVK